ncbi:hypothetical protein GA830_10265 [Mesorhizobium sp. NBSH29]|uniref:hypothetical protein n=1 Tax=Mesorhizobium sp. NBSH29 TaxID=2654249 RepID=UPI0018969F8A|nr:hypothetical protein [Mesorhizobium sp. NBSH29]QPC87079.1 hypothetical protein GA830_10265 [Mesorhizobium sp. NBSH29]
MSAILFRQRAANILRNFHRTSEHPEASESDIEAALDALDRARISDQSDRQITKVPSNNMLSDFASPEHAPQTRGKGK